MIKAVIFDLNETLLDLSRLEYKFNNIFNDKNVIKYWFVKLLHSSLVVDTLERYVDFSILAKSSLDSICNEYNIELDDSEKKNLLSTFRNLSLYKDVIDSLKLLKNNSISVYVLSNSSNQMIHDQLNNSNLINYIDGFFSVDKVKAFKPNKKVYKYALDQINLNPKDCFMVACHDWDLLGAKNIDMNTGYINRSKAIYNENYIKADIESDNLLELSKKICTFI